MPQVLAYYLQTRYALSSCLQFNSRLQLIVRILVLSTKPIIARLLSSQRAWQRDVIQSTKRISNKREPQRTPAQSITSSKTLLLNIKHNYYLLVKLQTQHITYIGKPQDYSMLSNLVQFTILKAPLMLSYSSNTIAPQSYTV